MTFPLRSKPASCLRSSGRTAPARPARLIASAIDTADAIKRAGLAGAVRPDERKQLAGFDRKGNVIEDGQTSDAQPQVLDRELSHTTSAIGDTALSRGRSGARRQPGRGRTPVRPGGP